MEAGPIKCQFLAFRLFGENPARRGLEIPEDEIYCRVMPALDDLADCLLRIAEPFGINVHQWQRGILKQRKAQDVAGQVAREDLTTGPDKGYFSILRSPSRNQCRLFDR